MQGLAIVGLSVLAAIVYGILHDQITARICVEYFTIGHEPIFRTQSPTLIALGWGVLATWWVGFLLGVPLAAVARAGRRPKRNVRSLVRPIGILMVVMAACALLAGITGAVLAHCGVVRLMEPMASRVPAEKHVAFLADLWAHNASYLGGFVGGFVVIVGTWQSRSDPVAGA